MDMGRKPLATGVRMFCVRLPNDVYDRLRDEAEVRGMTPSALAREILGLRLAVPGAAQTFPPKRSVLGDKVSYVEDAEDLPAGVVDLTPPPTRRERKKVERLAPGEESFATPHVHKFKPATAGAFIGECACGERGRV